jgi:hypothetical protein
MSRLVKFFAIAALIAGAFTMTPDPAAAQHHGGRGGGGHWGGGGGHWGGGGGHWGGGGYWGRRGWGGGWGPGFVLGFGPGWGWGGYPYSYYGDYYGAPSCGWVPVRRWRNHHWVLRRAWRCW